MQTDLSRRGVLAGAGVMAASAALAACGGKSTGSGTGSAAAKTGSKPRTGNGTYAEVLAYTSAPYFYDHKLGLEAAGKALGVKTAYLGPSDFDVNKMLQTMQETVAQKPSGILVTGFDPRLKQQIDDAIASGIPVVTVDADVADSNRLSFLGTANTGAGQVGGKELARLMGNKGKVMIVSITGQANLDERVKGYKQALSAAGIEVVQVANDGGDPTKAAAAVTAGLRAHPDIGGIACVEASGGRGAATALKEAGKTGQVKVVSMDRDPETLQAIEEGGIQASVGQQTALMTFYAVQLLHSYQTVDMGITTDDKAAGVPGMPPFVDTGTALITKDTVKYWKRSS